MKREESVPFLENRERLLVVRLTDEVGLPSTQGLRDVKCSTWEEDMRMGVHTTTRLGGGNANCKVSALVSAEALSEAASEK